jgi:bidirectional [NiFe] hydrogenase diaphorase subunit
MPVKSNTLAPPSDDKRWRVVEAAMRRNGYEGHALIETLHSIQDTFGYLDAPSLRYAAARLRLPLSKVYGVATFYHFFSLKPQGKHLCVVCMGTSCYIKGAPTLLDAVEETLHIRPGETTTDGEVSLSVARCIGSCGLAPVCVLDGAVTAHIDPPALTERLQAFGQPNTGASDAPAPANGKAKPEINGRAKEAVR